ncbi:hypothetical protein ANCCAN_22149 [Ancylostoma caninum]|uniref:Uncharacterized protein n=1 Tax=Ancylostoma caninum TaxID=29170 RepID=A0A368FMN1_ANCCA|nr:hypothetical protein ANCCAN_22149 [Ancylostoma caninum]
MAVEDGLSLLLGENDTLLGRLKELFQNLWKRDPTKHMRDCSRLAPRAQGDQAKKMDMCWNCLYQLLCRLNEEKISLSFVLAENSDGANFDGSEWELVQEMIGVLKPLDFAIDLVKHRFFTPISVVIPLYKVIVRQLRETSCMKTVKDAICNRLSDVSDGRVRVTG